MVSATLVALVAILAGGVQESCSSPEDAGTLRLLLVRHAESENNVLNLVSKDHYVENRHSDPDITELGTEQAQEAARFICASRTGLMRHLTEVRISPTLRTLQTARPFASRLSGVRMVVDSEIFEAGGVYERCPQTGDVVAFPGLTKEDMAVYGYELPPEVTSKGWNTIQGKESRDAAKSRALRVAERLRAEAAEQKNGMTRAIALVSHGDFIGFLLSHLIGTDLSRVNMHVWNTAMTCVDLHSDGSVTLNFFNSVAHLRSDQYRQSQLGNV